MRRWGAPVLPDGLRICRESWVGEWQMCRYPIIYPGVVFAGVHAYARLVYEFEVKPAVLETDPGPLDARVP